MTRDPQLAQIHIARKALGLDEEIYRDVVERITGQRSSSGLSARHKCRLIDEFRRLGWKGGVKQGVKRGGYKAAPRADLRLVHVLWRKLGDAGAVRTPGRAGLNRFIRARFEGTWKSVPIDVDILRDHHQISQLINALKAWCARINVDPDR